MILFLLFLFACDPIAIEDDLVLDVIEYELKVGEDYYLAFTDNHVYVAWYGCKRTNLGNEIGEGDVYISGVETRSCEWSPTRSPNVRCSANYTAKDNTIHIEWYDGRVEDYHIVSLQDGLVEVTCGADCRQVWQMTKKNHYIHTAVENRDYSIYQVRNAGAFPHVGDSIKIQAVAQFPSANLISFVRHYDQFRHFPPQFRDEDSYEFVWVLRMADGSERRAGNYTWGVGFLEYRDNPITDCVLFVQRKKEFGTQSLTIIDAASNVIHR